MKARREILIEYLKSAVDVGDWHAVSDAANDLRVLEAQEPREKRFIDLTIGTFEKVKPFTRGDQKRYDWWST